MRPRYACCQRLEANPRHALECALGDETEADGWGRIFEAHVGHLEAELRRAHPPWVGKPSSPYACTHEHEVGDVIVDDGCVGCLVAIAVSVKRDPYDVWVQPDGTESEALELLVGALHRGTPEFARLTDALIAWGVIPEGAIP